MRERWDSQRSSIRHVHTLQPLENSVNGGLHSRLPHRAPIQNREIDTLDRRQSPAPPARGGGDRGLPAVRHGLRPAPRPSKIGSSGNPPLSVAETYTSRDTQYPIARFLISSRPSYRSGLLIRP